MEAGELLPSCLAWGLLRDLSFATLGIGLDGLEAQSTGALEPTQAACASPAVSQKGRIALLCQRTERTHHPCSTGKDPRGVARAPAKFGWHGGYSGQGESGREGSRGRGWNLDAAVGPGGVLGPAPPTEHRQIQVAQRVGCAYPRLVPLPRGVYSLLPSCTGYGVVLPPSLFQRSSGLRSQCHPIHLPFLPPFFTT